MIATISTTRRFYAIGAVPRYGPDRVGTYSAERGQPLRGEGLLAADGVIEKTGRFIEASELKAKLSPAVMSRLCEQDGEPAFILAENTHGKVFLTQRDIREMQLAKAAIRAGIKLLQQKAGIKDDDIERILLAGAFGNYIRPKNALRIGLLPAVGPERIHFVGNAASSGAEMILVSWDCRDQAQSSPSTV